MADSQNVQQSRDMLMYVAPYSASNAMPSDSAWGTAPGGAYRDVGYTDGGLGFNVGMTYEDVTVDQSIDPIAVIPTGRDLRLTGNLAELTPQNLKDATSQGTLATVAASSGVRGHIDLDFDSTINVNYLTGLFDVKMSLGTGEALRIALWRAQIRSAIQATFSATGKVVLPVEMQGFPDPNNSGRVMKFRKILPAL